MSSRSNGGDNESPGVPPCTSVGIRARAAAQRRAATADAPSDSRRTAEAIMKKAAPELYEVLVDAGEVDE